MAQISEVRSITYQGTILAGGTLTAEIDTAGASLQGLISDANLSLGTLSFQVSGIPDSDGEVSYGDVVNEVGTVVSIGPVSGVTPVSADQIIKAIAPYRYVKIKMTPAQTNGVKFYLPSKAV